MSPRYPRGLLLLQTLLFYAFYAREASTSTLERQHSSDAYQSLSQNLGLYNSSDKVHILNSKNFKSIVYGNEKNAWLVEFYNSWCGFCQRFAPLWKTLASDVHAWNDVVRIAALDCADDDNNPLCREYEIMRYPEVRYFAPGLKPPSLGVDMEKASNPEGLRHNLVARLRKEQQEGRGSSWPNITPFRSSETKDMWEGASPSARYYFFLFEEVNSTLGAEIILDFRNIKSIVIRSVTSDNGPLCLVHRITKFPSLVVYSRDGEQKHLSIRLPTRQGTRMVVEGFLNSRGVETNLDVEDVDAKESKQNGTTPSSKIGEVEFNSSSAKEDATRGKILGDALYRADLEATLRYAFAHEIPMKKTIDGERMTALKKMTNILASYFPTEGANPMFLATINLVVKSKKTMSGEEFSALVTSTEEEMAPVYTEKHEWVACKPSKVGLRGYPCGLWTLFHTLTVNFAEKREQREKPNKILDAMHGYIEQFFGCADCAKHFVAMAAKNHIFDVNSADDSVLWLWEAHNEVNARLAGDDTEDPAHKKIQYPSVEHCPTCRDSQNGSWNTSQVLAYLKKKYSNPLTLNTKSSDHHTYYNNRIRRERRVSGDIQAKRFRWDFTVFDISICVVLYVASAAILVLVCVKFAVKRSHKRRMFVQSILGKV